MKKRFDELTETYEMCSVGEQLFGLPVTNYPILDEKKENLKYLQELYSYYDLVNSTINNYYEEKIKQVDFRKVTEQITEFHNQ